MFSSILSEDESDRWWWLWRVWNKKKYSLFSLAQKYEARDKSTTIFFSFRIENNLTNVYAIKAAVKLKKNIWYTYRSRTINVSSFWIRFFCNSMLFFSVFFRLSTRGCRGRRCCCRCCFVQNHLYFLAYIYYFADN